MYIRYYWRWEAFFDLIHNKIDEYERGNNTSMPVSNIAITCSKLFHTNTLYSGTRPFGINILICGYDKNGSNLYEITQDGYFDIELTAAIGTESDINKKLIKQTDLNFQSLSVDELIYYSTQFMFKGQNQFVNYLHFKKQYDIFLVGKKSKFTFFNSKISQFFNKSYSVIKNLDK